MPEKTNDRNYLSGNARKIPYTITPPASGEGRFSYAWNAFKRSFGSFITINLLMLVCFTPLIAMFFMRSYYLSAAGIEGPFGANVGLGYPSYPDMAGVAEKIVLTTDLVWYALALACSLIAAIGVAGGAYSLRKILRSEERWKFVDFFVGVKQNWLISIVATALVFAILFVCAIVYDACALAVATGGNGVLFVVLRILITLVTAAVMLFALWLMAVGTNYKLSVWGNLRNAFVLCGGTIVPSVLMAALSAAAFLLIVVDAISMLGFMFFALFGLSYVLYVWLAFADWTFDRYADYTVSQNEMQQAELKKMAVGSAKEEDVLKLLLVEGKSEYLSRAVQPVTEGESLYNLPVDFNGEDLKALKESREKIASSADAYAAAHADEKKYKEYNEAFADRNKVVVATDKKGKKQKFEPQMLQK